MPDQPEFFCGQELRAVYPFVRTTYEKMPDELGEMPCEAPTWKPGVEHHATNWGDVWSEADANGEVVYTVIGTFKPGGYPKRVFYLRNWIDPDGKRFGKNALRVTTAQNFRNLIKGYRHEYELSDEDSND